MMKLEIVTPEEKAFSDDIDMVVLPGVDGELGILPNHIPLVTQIKPGELRVTKNGRDTWLAVGEGFVEITQTKVTVLTDGATEESAIDEAAAEAAIARAEQAMSEEGLNDEEVAAVQSALLRSMAQLHLKRRRRGG